MLTPSIDFKLKPEAKTEEAVHKPRTNINKRYLKCLINILIAQKIFYGKFLINLLSLLENKQYGNLLLMLKFFKKYWLVFVFLGLLTTGKLIYLVLTENQKPVYSADKNDYRFYINKPDSGSSRGGLIAISSEDDPQISIESYKYNGPVQVNLYQAGRDELFQFLLHDNENNQVNPKIDVSGLNLVSSEEEQINTAGRTISLPLDKQGIYIIRLKKDGSTHTGVIVRSTTGAVVKEGDNEFVFWGQNFSSGRRIDSGTVKLYSFLGRPKELYSTNFNQNGIAKTPFFEEADIGLVEHNNGISVVPINLNYLNFGGSWNRFFQNDHARYFIFTDRPIYKPGDKVYFKAILRNDDDVRYTVPTGKAKVTIYQGWGDDKTIFYEKDLPISPAGTVYDEYRLEEDMKTGNVNLSVELPGTVTGSGWFGPKSSKSTTDFKVEHYRKPEYTIDLETDRNEYISGDEISLSISGNYFFGQPLAGEKALYKITANDFYDPQYLPRGNYNVSDRYHYGWYLGTDIKEDTVQFDDNGEAEVKINAAIPEKYEGQNNVYSIETEFKDETGNPVYDRRNVLVYAGEFSFYRSDEYRYHYRINEEVELPLVLVPNLDNKLDSGIELTADLKRKYWVKKSNPNRKYPDYEQKTEDLSDLTTVTNNENRASFSFTPEKTGRYVLNVSTKDKRGNVIKKTFSFWITSRNKPTYYYGRENEIQIFPDKEKYLPGDTAQLTIAADQELENRDVLLTFERERLNRYEVVRLEGQNTVVEIPIIETDMPNMHAVVSGFGTENFYSGSKELIVSPEQQRLDIEIKPNSQTYGPGENVNLTIETKDISGNPLPVDLAVWAVDKAIYELATDPKDVFEQFWQERYDRTQESHSLQGIHKSGAEGGGGCFTSETPILMADGKTKPISKIVPGDLVMSKDKKNKITKAKVIEVIEHKKTSGILIVNQNLKITPEHLVFADDSWKEAGKLQVGDQLISSQGDLIEVETLEWQKGLFDVYNLHLEKPNTFFADNVWVHNEKGGAGYRDTFEDTAYWNPVVKTGDNGKTQVSFELPDNLTTWVIQAVGSTNGTKVGQELTEIIVTKDLIVRPIMPNLLRQGDEFNISALIHNYTDQNQIVDISLDCPETKFLTGKTHQDLEINSRDRKQVFWKIKAEELTKNAEFTFNAKTDQGKLKWQDTIVQEIPIEEVGFWEKSAMFKSEPTSFEVELAEDANVDKTSVILNLAPNMLGTLPSAMRYLAYYPWGCVEQITSRLVPSLITKKYPELFSEVLTDKNVDEMVEKAIQKLNNSQQPSGGWSWWESKYASPFVTSYVVEQLLLARELGYDVDEAIFTRARRFLENPKSYNQNTNQYTNAAIDQKIASQYGLSLLTSENNFPEITNFEGLTPDIVALGTMANLNNGYSGSKGIEKLKSMAQKQGSQIYWEKGGKDNFGSIEASTAMAIRALVQAGESDLAANGLLYLINNRNQRYWGNTFGTAEVVLAATTHADKYSGVKPNYNYQVDLDDEIVKKGVINQADQSIEIDFSKLISNKKQTITIKKTGEGKVYSILTIDQFRTNPQAAEVSRGVKIKREYISEKGENYSLAIGDKVKVRLTVEGLNDNQNYGLIADQLPAGLIPINTTLENAQYHGRDARHHWGSALHTTPNGANISLYQIKSGTNTYTYLARAILSGEFRTPPVTGELMYSPSVYGRSTTDLIKITEDSEMIYAPASSNDPVVTADKLPLIKIAAWTLTAVGILAGGFWGFKKISAASSIRNQKNDQDNQ